MKLECTKKLLDFLGVKPEKGITDPNTDPLFAWTANLILLNRRKVIVVTHTASHCTFLLYGVTAKNLRNIQELIFDGLRTLLQTIYIRPQIVEQYLDDCGKAISFAANSSRSAVATCNKACERVRSIGDLLAPNDLFQQPFLYWLSKDVLLKGDYTYSHQCFIALLQKRYGTEVQACRAVELEVTLNLDTPCKRRLIVPSDLNFYQLHCVLQDAFGWKDCHIHEFILEIDRYDRATKLIAEPLGDDADFGDEFAPELIDESRVTLTEIFANYTSILYLYDFGDYWMHLVEVKGFHDDCSTVYPLCTEAVGDAPMEDCGGPDGFAEIMKILNQPEHPEYEDVRAWVRSSLWHPVDLENINFRLKCDNRMPIPVSFDFTLHKFID